MEQTQKKPMTDVEFEVYANHLKTLNRHEAAEAAVHFVMANIINGPGQRLEIGQKIDLVNAALDTYRAAILAEFSRVISSTPERPYGLLMEKDNPELMKALQAAVALAVVKSEEKIEPMAKRLFTLCEMLAPEKKEETTVN